MEAGRGGERGEDTLGSAVVVVKGRIDRSRWGVGYGFNLFSDACCHYLMRVGYKKELF